MNQFNFPKVKQLFYFIVSILLTIIMFAALSPLQAFAESPMLDTKLLLIIEDSAQKPTLDDKQAEKVEYKFLSEISNADSNHIAYATSKDIANIDEVRSILQYAFRRYDARVYIYGNLTISEFKNILDIDLYSIETNIYDENGITDKKANMAFSEEQEENKVQQIISLSKSSKYQSLMAEVPYATYNNLETIIVNHYLETFVNPMLYATIVQNVFDYRNYGYFGGGAFSSYCYLSYDYILYKIEDESVSNYDYFAIRVNATPVYDNPDLPEAVVCNQLQMKLSLPYVADHIVEYGPYSSNKANEINVQLGFGAEGVSGSVGFTFAPGTGPSVDTTYTPQDRTVLWKVSKYWFFGSKLNNALYPFGVSWASTGRLAAINISTYVEFSKGDVYSNWDEVQVRYSY